MQSSTLASFHCATAFYAIMSTKIDWFNFACAPCHLRKVLFLSFREVKKKETKNHPKERHFHLVLHHTYK